jgi:hypothetical protein
VKFERILKLVPIEIKQLIEKCKTVPQDADWHPEAPNDIVPHNVFKHTKIVYNRALTFGDVDLQLSALFHDLGKVKTTVVSTKKNNSWQAIDHELESAALVKTHKKWIEKMGGNWENVFEIVSQHMRIKFMNEMKLSKRQAIERNILFKKFVKFLEFDNMQTLNQDELNS